MINSIKIFGYLIAYLLFFVRCNDKNEPDNTPPQTFFATFESEYVRYQKGEKAIAQLDTTKIVRIWADTVWKNEKTYKQVIVWSTQKEKIENISFVVSDLKDENNNIINSSAITLQYITYVWGNVESLLCGKQSSTSKVQITDALLDNPITTIESGESMKIWTTFTVPQNAIAGKYKGTISIKSGEILVQTLPLDFLITTKQLPAVANWDFHLDLWQFPFQIAKWANVTPFSMAHINVIEPFYRKLADAGQKSITTYIKDGAFNFNQTMITWIKKNDGTWGFDFTNFDTYVSKMMEWGITKQINCLSILGWNPKVIGYFDEQSISRKELTFTAITDPEFTQVWQTMLTAFKTHLKEKGWFDKAVLYMDEDTESNLSYIINLIEANDTQWKIGLAGRWMPENIEKKLHDYATVLEFNRYSNTNNSVATFYTSCSQYYPNNYVSLKNSAVEMTWMAWHARAKGLNGYLRWAYDYWQNTDPFDACDLTNTAGDFSMIYRSSNGASCKPVSSIRFELLRRGIQDYEKIRSLDDPQLNQFLDQNFTLSSLSQSEIMPNIVAGQSLIKKISAQ